jgi:hypothetical protein
MIISSIGLGNHWRECRSAQRSPLVLPIAPATKYAEASSMADRSGMTGLARTNGTPRGEEYPRDHSVMLAEGSWFKAAGHHPKTEVLIVAVLVCSTALHRDCGNDVA